MDRVFYDDNTFEAPCPECDTTEWLYRKNNELKNWNDIEKDSKIIEVEFNIATINMKSNG